MMFSLYRRTLLTLCVVSLSITTIYYYSYSIEESVKLQVSVNHQTSTTVYTISPTRDKSGDTSTEKAVENIEDNGKNAGSDTLATSARSDTSSDKSTEEIDDELQRKEKQCYILNESYTNITTNEIYSSFNTEIEEYEIWDAGLENRFYEQNNSIQSYPLKVIICLHSHNDPGWLRTFSTYFEEKTRLILNTIIENMEISPDLTFVWSEISFLSLWWNKANPKQQRTLKDLIDSGRFEIVTGGWVMTDEANVHLYAMLDQLIEGHQWLRNNLNVTPTIGWSIDPFGHGSTIPYLLSASNFEGTIIQRIHYAWKRWFAERRAGDFIWTPYWQQDHKVPPSKRGYLLTHNLPFSIYSVENSCGPYRSVCKSFDFTKDYEINDENIKTEAEKLLGQYERTASLFPHNVAIIPIGNDFTYTDKNSLMSQYDNYKKLVDYMRASNVDISFGTPRDYFNAIQKRCTTFPSLKGDFFVYADNVGDNWSGYYTSRPFYKILSNDLEHNLRATEILFTVAYNRARQKHNSVTQQIFDKYYTNIKTARRNLGLFQHHDAITGTSKEEVMHDYGQRLFNSIQEVIDMQQLAIEMLIQKQASYLKFLTSELERNVYNELPKKIHVPDDENDFVKVVVFNPLAQRRFEVITLCAIRWDVQILNERNETIENMQVNLARYTKFGCKEKPSMLMELYEIMFVAELQPLSLTTFRLVYGSTKYSQDHRATTYCNDCIYFDVGNDEFKPRSISRGDIEVVNNHMWLQFDRITGLLKAIRRKSQDKFEIIPCSIDFHAYFDSYGSSGAYIFKTTEEKTNFLAQYKDVKISMTTGPIATDVTVTYNSFLTHRVRLLNTSTYLDAGIFIENYIDFGEYENDTDLIMQFTTTINNTVNRENLELPIFYSDQNSFQYHKRIKNPNMNIASNYFPITSGAFMQDAHVRFTLLTTHAQGAASDQPGQLEVVLDRRTTGTDSRGMNEALTENWPTQQNFWILVEDMPAEKANNYQVPSLLVTQLANGLRYPPILHFITPKKNLKYNLKTSVQLLNDDPLPCDVHLLNFRTLTNENVDDLPSPAALLVLQRQGYDCRVGRNINVSSICPTRSSAIPSELFLNLNVRSIESTSLTATLPLSRRERLNSFADIQLSPMELRTFNISFQ